MERSASMMSDSSDDTDYVPTIVCPVCSAPFETEHEAMTHVSVCLENEALAHDEEFARTLGSSGPDHFEWSRASPMPRDDGSDGSASDGGEEDRVDILGGGGGGGEEDVSGEDTFPCPLCNVEYPLSRIETHAARCMGVPEPPRRVIPSPAFVPAPVPAPASPALPAVLPVPRDSDPAVAAPAAAAAAAAAAADAVPEGHKKCPYCDTNVSDPEYDVHIEGHHPVTCAKCHKDLEARLLADHEPVCIGPTSSCPFCSREVRDAIFDEHVIDCQERSNAEQR